MGAQCCQAMHGRRQPALVGGSPNIKIEERGDERGGEPMMGWVREWEIGAIVRFRDKALVIVMARCFLALTAGGGVDPRV